MRRLLLSSVPLVTLAAGGPGLAASPTAQEGGAATVIDFRALGADGKPVRDLKAEEVTIRIAGRARPVKSLRLVEPAGAAGTAAPAAALPPPFGTNTGGGDTGGRLVLIVVEDEALPVGGERAVRDAVTAYVGTLSAGDRVSFSIAPRDTARVGFDAGAARVKEALAQLSGRHQTGASASEDQCRSRDTLLHLRALLSPLAGSETPVTVLFFSSELSTPSRTQASPGSCDLTTEHYQNLGLAAAAARAHFYVINSDVSVSQRNEGLETMSSVTGAGPVLRLAGQADVLSRVAEETSAYYLATVDAEQSDRAGQGQRLEVRIGREGVTPRFRPEAVLARAAGAKPGASASARDMLRQTQPFRDLPVRTAGYASRDADGRVRVLVLSEPVDPATKLKAAEVALIDSAGKMVPQAIDQKQLGSFPIISAHSVAPGTYRLRFAAVDQSGKGGAADYTVNAALTDAGPLKLSGVVLGALINNNFAPRLLFRDEASVVGYMEIYGQLTGQVSARMEVASSIDGPAIATVQPGGRGTNEPDKFMLTAEIPIAALAPGDYVVRAFVNIQGQPEGRVMATLRKLAK